MTWTPAYNTNGMAHHRLDDALALLAELGYGGVALTLDNHHLDPFGPHLAEEIKRVRDRLQRSRLGCIIESGARFNLDPRVKHYPSLMTRAHRGRRIEFLKRCIDIANDLGASCVSFWSGHNFDDLPAEEAFELLAAGIEDLLPHAEERGVDLAFEPEPGMFVELMSDWDRLKALFPSPRFGLALDLGHLMVTEEIEIPDAIRRWRGDITTVAIEDMKRGEHVHLPFGEGDMEFKPIFQALTDIGYRGLLSVELSRGSSDAVRHAESALRFLETQGRN